MLGFLEISDSKRQGKPKLNYLQFSLVRIISYDPVLLRTNSSALGPTTTTYTTATTTSPILCPTCSFHSKCEVKSGVASCVCPSLCPALVSPVCGSNGVTYGNLCELKRDSCKNQQSIDVVNKGPCMLEVNVLILHITLVYPSFGITFILCFILQIIQITLSVLGLNATVAATTITPCAVVKCGYFATCNVINGSAACVCSQSCGNVSRPVCGSDGVTYENICELEKSSCEQQKHITVAKNGMCGKSRCCIVQTYRYDRILHISQTMVISQSNCTYDCQASQSN
jgi:hypothetical protein